MKQNYLTALLCLACCTVMAQAISHIGFKSGFLKTRYYVDSAEVSQVAFKDALSKDVLCYDEFMQGQRQKRLGLTIGIPSFLWYFSTITLVDRQYKPGAAAWIGGAAGCMIGYLIFHKGRKRMLRTVP